MAMMTVNGRRLQAHLEALADIARTPDGICRLSYSDSFWKSNAYVAQLMREAGMTVSANPVGNVVGTYPGRTPQKITVGSHIDSVVNGGIFDGCLGVLAGIEAVHTLSENGIVPEHSIDVVSFAEEEGLVITGLIGSRAYCGLPPTEPVMEKMEFSSKSPGFRPEVSARVVESGRSSPEAAELAELLAELGASELLAVEPPQPARMLQASAAHSRTERMRVYLDFIAVSSMSSALAQRPQHFKTIHSKYTFCRGGCQSDSAERISSGKYALCTKKKRIFGNFAFLTFFAKIG